MARPCSHQPASKTSQAAAAGTAAAAAASHAAPKLRKLKVSGPHHELGIIPLSVTNTRHAGGIRASERGGRSVGAEEA